MATMAPAIMPDLTRLLQVRISEDAHRRLRLEAARLDLPLGRVLSDLIVRCLPDMPEPTPEPGK